jgi:hypothetical protein
MQRLGRESEKEAGRWAVRSGRENDQGDAEGYKRTGHLEKMVRCEETLESHTSPGRELRVI